MLLSATHILPPGKTTQNLYSEGDSHPQDVLDSGTNLLISRLPTVSPDGTDEALPALGRVEDLSVVDAVLPEDVQALSPPRSSFPMFGGWSGVSFLRAGFDLAVGDCGVAVAEVPCGG